MLRLEIGGEKYILTYGKSIELFLVNGTADSLITAELSNWNGKAIKIPYRGHPVPVPGKKI